MRYSRIALFSDWVTFSVKEIVTTWVVKLVKPVRPRPITNNFILKYK